MSQRCKILKIGASFFPSLLGKGVRQFYEVDSDGIPSDAVVVNCRMSDDFRSLILLISSSEFEAVPEHMNFPEITPALRSFDLKTLPLAEAAN